MSDLEPESFAEFVTSDGPGSADVDEQPVGPLPADKEPQGPQDVQEPPATDDELEARPGSESDVVERGTEDEPDEENYR
ncbi:MULTISPECIES: hypothetical protein [Actinoplanes]|uniref:Uncharacterized protein n=2 Tax=Actinoplanes TaxID=1865 RepID=A0A101JM23_9ACTN|nr:MULTISPECIES: hypothetical protein [Actinoplanes]KUL29296.1 hypothetical protein ADL15_29525 [Actinoplanes awajinensis subsp. mycoplanecinus]GIE64212.1 hypothetical protein Apa02nite_003200 [Actinoplanes palleronii]